MTINRLNLLYWTNQACFYLLTRSSLQSPHHRSHFFPILHLFFHLCLYLLFWLHLYWLFLVMIILLVPHLSFILLNHLYLRYPTQQYLFSHIPFFKVEVKKSWLLIPPLKSTSTGAHFQAPYFVFIPYLGITQSLFLKETNVSKILEKLENICDDCRTQLERKSAIYLGI